jgi:predicted nucleic acid-binding protein
LILFVETTFVLELAFLQPGHAHCRALLEMAKAHDDLELALPASCVVEAYAKQIARQKRRTEMHRTLVAELGDLSRSKPYAERSRKVREITTFMATTGDEERKRLDAVLTELYTHTSLLPLDDATAEAAPRLGRSRGLEPQDALVYASVVARLSSLRATAPSVEDVQHCFVTTDRHFSDDDIRADLAAFGCRILRSFEAAVGHVGSRPR